MRFECEFGTETVKEYREGHRRLIIVHTFNFKFIEET